MYNLKFIISVSIFIFFLIITSIVKNQSRILEKKIIGLKSSVLFKENNLSETQLEFSYLTSLVKLKKNI